MRLLTDVKKHILSLALHLLFFTAFTQSSFAPIDEDYYSLIERYAILNNNNSLIFSTFKPYQRENISSLLEQIAINASRADQFYIEYLKNDNWEFGTVKKESQSNNILFKRFYKKKSDFLHIKKNDFDLHLSPIFHFGFGKESGDTNKSLFINTRGIRIRGQIDNKFSFFTSFTENQAIFPRHVHEYSQNRIAVPGYGFWKAYGDTGFDFLDARGYVNFRASKHVNIQFGQDKNFIGSGIRSFILSDFGPSYPFLKLQTKIWKLQYTNLYSQLISEAQGNSGGSFGTMRFPKKFFMLHHLSVNLSDKLNIGVFESIVMRGSDSTGVTPFELSYLNPIIFYRAAEQQTGSPDNTSLGLDFRWNSGKRSLIYGQFGLDELIISKFLGGEGAWENKFFGQFGFKYVNVLALDNLDLNTEINVARPYLYTHNSSANYSHYNQALGHPLGANFYELIGSVRYKIIPRLELIANLVVSKYGEDEPGNEESNFGKDIFKPNTKVSANRPLGNYIGQGLSTNLFIANFRTSYMLKHNLFIDLGIMQRTVDSDAPTLNSSRKYINLGLRLNSSVKTHLY